MRLPLSSLLIIVSFCAISSACGPRAESSSEDCGPEIPFPALTISQINGQPTPVGLDIPIQRQNGASIDVQIDYSVRRGINFCGKGYMGPLTFALQPVSQGVTGMFDPVTIPASTSYQPQISHLNISISNSVPDGPIALSINAQENKIGNQNYRLILSTKP